MTLHIQMITNRNPGPCSLLHEHVVEFETTVVSNMILANLLPHVEQNSFEDHPTTQAAMFEHWEELSRSSSTTLHNVRTWRSVVEDRITSDPRRNLAKGPLPLSTIPQRVFSASSLLARPPFSACRSCRAHSAAFHTRDTPPEGPRPNRWSRATSRRQPQIALGAYFKN